MEGGTNKWRGGGAEGGREVTRDGVRNIWREGGADRGGQRVRGVNRDGAAVPSVQLSV